MTGEAATLCSLLTYTRDGEWGSANPGTGLVPIRVIRGTDFGPVRQGDLTTVPIRYLRAEHSKRKALRPGDILIETAGGSKGRPTGRTLLIQSRILDRAETPFTCASFARFLRVDEGRVNAPYLYWFFQYLYQIGEMEQHQVQHTGIARFQFTRFSEEVQVPLPPLSEQRAIAHILGTLDDKIELNRRTNQTLEEMARVLFKSWFVDFDPVHAKATLKRHATTIPQRGSDWSVERARAYLDGMAPDIAGPFPDRFDDSELGPIPEGWEVVPLAEVMEINPPRPLRRGNIAPYLDMANMPMKGHTPKGVVDRPFGSGMRFAYGDTLLARITPCLENGKTAYVDFLKENQIGWGSTEYIVLRPKAPLPSEFAYCLGRNASFREFAIQNMTGTSGRQRVSATAISNYRMTIPKGIGIPRMFGQLVGPLFMLASQNADESHTLTTLRDTLLPKLVSGAMRIKDFAPRRRVPQLDR